LRRGSFLLIRDLIEDELEHAFAGRKPAKAALDSAVARQSAVEPVRPRQPMAISRPGPVPLNPGPVPLNKGTGWN
jgi:hypothetical protein